MMINKSIEFFNKLNLPLNEVLDDIAQFLPMSAFVKPSLQTTEVRSGGTKWQILPIRRCDVLSIRNGKLAKLPEQGCEIDYNAFIGDLETSDDLFVYGIHGTNYCLKQPETGIVFNIYWYGVIKNFSNMDLLWKTEYANLLMSIKIKDSASVFEGLKRLKFLQENSFMENSIRPANYASNEAGNEVLL